MMKNPYSNLLALAAVLAMLAQPAAATPRKPLVLDGGGNTVELPAADTLQARAPTTANASANLPHGTAPTSPVDGDMWSTTAGLFMRVNGVTVGPYGAGGGGSPGGSSGQIQYNNSGAFGGFTLGGDCTFSVPNVTCAKTGGVSFGYFATGTDASNLTGTVSVNRFNSGTGASSSTFLRGDGTWVAPSAGTVITTGSPASGNLTKFSGAASITNGDLSGDCITSGALAITCSKTGGVAFAASATTDTTSATNITTGTLGAARLPLATSSTVGAVQPDNVTTTVSGGVITAIAGGTIASSGSVDAMWFGDGADGDLTISAGTTTITRDMYYHNLTITGGSLQVGTAGGRAFAVFVSGTLDISSAPAGAIKSIVSNGGNATANVGTSGGQGASGTGTVGLQITGATGANGGTGAGTIGTVAGASSPTLGGLSGSSGAGGAVGATAGGAARAASTAGVVTDIRRLSQMLWSVSSGTFSAPQGGMGAPSGGSGAGDGVGSGGGSGAGGVGGGIVYLAARTINRSGTTVAGAILAAGGNGGNGASGTGGTNRGGGGGGAGGGGGWVYLIYRTLTGSLATGALDASGGNGGAGGNGVGTGNGGNGGGAGGGGRIDVYDIGVGTQVILNPTAAAAGNAASGGTGGAAKTATAQQANL